ncbi:MAG: peptidoglycan editing factor PgeF [Syntrophaceae bacterium]|nr:peptidoglycan editing factor PgeF [Syntrophaceae bacterium]
MNRSVLKMKKGLPYFEIPEMAKLGWLRHGFLTRQGGVSLPPYDSLNVGDANGDRNRNVIRNRERIAETFGFEPSRLILLIQIHQDRILLLKDVFPSLPPLLEYDALITNIPNLFSGILTADCIPIFVVDRKKRAFAVIHAGRQGTAMHITKKVLRKMKEEFGSSTGDILIAAGPSIGPCCYEIDEKVFQKEWDVFSKPKTEGRWALDLLRVNRAQMKEEGIKENQIFRVDLCTRCHNDLFFSYRGEGRTGRQLSFIGIIQTNWNNGTLE